MAKNYNPRKGGMMPQGAKEFNLNDEWYKLAKQMMKYPGGMQDVWDAYTPEGRLLDLLKMWKHGVVTPQGGRHSGQNLE